MERPAGTPSASQSPVLAGPDDAPLVIGAHETLVSVVGGDIDEREFRCPRSQRLSPTALAATDAVPRVDVTVLWVCDLPVAPPVPGAPPPPAARASDTLPMVQVVGRIRLEDIAGGALAALDDEGPAKGGNNIAAEAMAASSASRTSVASSGNILLTTPAFRSCSSVPTGNATITSVTDDTTHRLVFYNPGIPLVDKNAPPERRQTAEHYVYLDLTVIEPTSASDYAPLPNKATCRLPGAGGRFVFGSARQPAYAVKKQKAPFGRATLYLNSREANVELQEQLHFCEPHGASGTLIIKVRLVQCGQLRAIAPPRPFSTATRSLFQAELEDMYTPEFTEACTKALLTVLCDRDAVRAWPDREKRRRLRDRRDDGQRNILTQGTGHSVPLTRDTSMADEQPGSASWQWHHTRDRVLRREKERWRPLSLDTRNAREKDGELDADAIHVPAYSPLPGVALNIEELNAFLFELHVNTGADVPAYDALLDNTLDALKRLARRQRVERVFVFRTEHPAAADTAIAEDATQREAQRLRRERELLNAAVQGAADLLAATDDCQQRDSSDCTDPANGPRGLSALAQIEAEEAAAADDAADSDDEYVLLHRAKQLRRQREGQHEAAVLRRAPDDVPTELLTGPCRAQGRSRARLGQSSLGPRTPATSADQSASAAAPTDSRCSSTEATPYYHRALEAIEAARELEHRRVAEMQARSAREVLLSVNEVARLLRLPDGLLLQEHLPRVYLASEARSAVPNCVVPGAAWQCPLLAALTFAAGDPVAMRRCAHMKLPPPSETFAAVRVVSDCIPAAGEYLGYKRPEAPAVIATSAPSARDEKQWRTWAPAPILDYNAVVCKEARRKERKLAQAQRTAAREGAGAKCVDVSDADVALTADEIAFMTTPSREASCENLAGVLISDIVLVRCNLRDCYLRRCRLVECTVEGGLMEACQVESRTTVRRVPSLRSCHICNECSIDASAPANCVILDSAISNSTAAVYGGDRSSTLQSGVMASTIVRCSMTSCTLVHCVVRECGLVRCRDDGGCLMQRLETDGVRV
jgi:hypothetical protein